MVDIVSIIIAVVSLIGSIAAAGFAGWISFYIDQVKRRSEAKALVHKYRDPLVQAAYDLQSRLFGIVQLNLLRYNDVEEKRGLVHVYTAFLVGQYLSWVYILRRQVQFVRFSTDKNNKQLDLILVAVTNEFSLDQNASESPFMLWRGQQMAIGELMTLTEEKGELYCMGYAAFSKKYQSDEDFKKWFQPIEDGIDMLVHAREHNDFAATGRLRRLQHLLIDLVLLLDPDRAESEKHKQLKVDAANQCECNKCPGRVIVAKSSSMSPSASPPEP